MSVRTRLSVFAVSKQVINANILSPGHHEYLEGRERIFEGVQLVPHTFVVERMAETTGSAFAASAVIMEFARLAVASVL